jgi:hypothetical protein
MKRLTSNERFEVLGVFHFEKLAATRSGYADAATIGLRCLVIGTSPLGSSVPSNTTLDAGRKGG